MSQNLWSAAVMIGALRVKAKQPALSHWIDFYTRQIKSLTLKVPIATNVFCFSPLLKCLRSLYGKQCGPRSDCSFLYPRKLCLWWVYCFHVVRPSVRPSVTFCFFNILKSHCWIFIKPCKHVHICMTNTLDKKVRARGQFYLSYFPL